MFIGGTMRAHNVRMTIMARVPNTNTIIVRKTTCKFDLSTTPEAFTYLSPGTEISNLYNRRVSNFIFYFGDLNKISNQQSKPVQQWKKRARKGEREMIMKEF